jgi:RNA-directed DNA polymerase
VNDITTEPEAVPVVAKTSGDTQARWAWVETAVWTERMLTALENGVQGGKWYSLMDKVVALPTLRKAFAQVKANRGASGVDHVTVEQFEQRLEENLEKLAGRLREGNYQAQAVRRVWIPKAGSKEKRPLGIPTVADRVAQAAVLAVLEPIFERDFAEHSYGFRPGRGCKAALRQVDGLLKQGHCWVVDADLKSYFDTIPHAGLLERVGAKIADGAVLELLASFLRGRAMSTAEGWSPEQGTPQGAVISPLLSNIYLDPLDQAMVEAGEQMVRYADDFVVLCRSREQAEAVLRQLQQWTRQAGLRLHEEKTRIVDATQPGGFDFLGYHFELGEKRPRAKSLRKFKDAVREHTRRTNGHSLSTVLLNLNRTLSGWFAYYKHSHRSTFNTLDCWVRMRLRSILRCRDGRRGRGRGWDNNRWTNAFFAEQGLFSLDRGHALACQSSSR